MMRGKMESGTEIVVTESFVADQVGEAVDKLDNLARLLGDVRQREAANTAADAAEWLHAYAQKIDATYASRRQSEHAAQLERMMQD
jgi:hypothetical protein